MGNALRFKNTVVARQPNEIARFKVVQGPDFGVTFVLTSARAVVGRGEDSDLLISDLKASRLHAEIVTGLQGWSVKDLGSANGILHNGKVVRSASLKIGDTITIGETTLEFFSAEARTMMLTAPPRDMEQVLQNQSALNAQKKKIKSLGAFGAPNATGSGSGKRGLPLPIILAGAGALAFLFFSTNDTPSGNVAKKSKTPTELGRNLAAYLPTLDSPIGKTAETLFRSGFREYRERNYLRAKTQFETVLQIAPGHQLAILYLENCNKEIENEVKQHLELGHKALEAGKTKESKGHYEAIQRLLFKDQSNPAFVQAHDELEKIAKSQDNRSGGSS